LLKRYLDSAKINNEKSADIKNFSSELKNLVDEIKSVLEYNDGKENYVLVYSDDSGVYCSKSLDKLVNKLKEIHCDEKDEKIEVFIHSLDEVLTIGSIVLNSEFEAQTYDLIRDYSISITDKYVCIPNNINMGDTIETVYSNDRYIVVNNLHSLDKFSNDTYKDSSVIAIPESVLDSNRDYKSQIEDIYMNRIKDIENPCAEPDIIMENYTSIPLVDIIKIE
jgi:hypothetical protein